MAGVFQKLVPGLAARRAEAQLRHARAENALLGEAKRAEILQSYDAANLGGRFSGWRRPQTSATTELQSALPYLRATSRDLVRNNPHAGRAVRVLASHIAGTGVRPRAKVAKGKKKQRDAIAAIAADQWDRFVENCDPTGQLDFYGQQRLIQRTVVEGGEALRLWHPEARGNKLLWRCQVLEGDMLDHQRNEVRPDGSKIVQGVEFDASGRRVAYWLYENHPGERYLAGGLGWESRRVDAQYVDHIYEILRPGQVRGVSWFAPVAMVLRDVDDLAEAEVVRKKLEACISMVIHNANYEGDGATGINQATDEAGAALTSSDGTAIERMQPGMVLEARPGWSVDFQAPPPSQGLTEHMKERLHAVAAGVGTTYAQMTGDLSSVNYSSMRGGELEFSRLVDIWQADLMITQSGRPAWTRVQRAGQLNGEFHSSLVLPMAQWTPPKRPWVDPQKDANAAIMQIDAGILSPQEVIARTGKTPEDVVRDLEEWRELTKGLNLKTNTKTAAKPGQEKGES